jgi:restriction system protein
MARRRSALDDLVALPWWFSVVLAIVAYTVLKYGFPAIGVSSPVVGSFFQSVSKFAPFVAALFLLAAAMAAVKAWRKGKLLDRQTGAHSIRSLSWRAFENLVGEMYRRQGYTIVETGGGADGGVDLILKKGGEKILVQCKQWKMTKVGVKVVRELYGVMTADGASQGIVLSSGDFTQEAKDFAKGKPLDLVPGTQLARMIAKVKKGGARIHKPTEPVVVPESPQPVETATSTNSPLCPRCGKEMVRRKARRGADAGKEFWACPGFPECRGTRPLVQMNSSP